MSALLQRTVQCFELGVLAPDAHDLRLQNRVRDFYVQVVVELAVPFLLFQLELHVVADVDLLVVLPQLVHYYQNQLRIVGADEEQRPLNTRSGPLSGDLIVEQEDRETDCEFYLLDGTDLLLEDLEVEVSDGFLLLALLLNILRIHNIQMQPRLPPVNPLGHLKSKGDLLPQVHFFGQITGGVDFDSADALLCQMTVETGSDWELIFPGKDKTYQTQTTYAEKGEMFVWAHPFDLHFKANELSGWPKLIVKVWRFNDSSSTNDLLAYGMAHLPKHPGYSKIQCQTWTPFGDWKYQTLSFFLGTQARLNNLNVISTNLEKRKRLFSQSSGKVIIEVECITKNFGVYNISQS